MSAEKKSDPFDINLIWRIFRLVAVHRKEVWGALILTLVLAVLQPSRPLLVRYALDNPIRQGDGNLLIQITILLGVLMIIQFGVQFFHAYLNAWLGQTAIRKLRSRIYNTISGFRLKYFDRTPVGTNISRTVSDVEAVAEVFSEGLINIVANILTLLVMLIVMFSLNWKLTLLCLSVLPLLLYSTYVFKEGIKSSYERVRNAVSRLNAFVQEQIQGMQILQLFNREEQEYKKFYHINKEHYNANNKQVLYYSIFFPVVEIITAMATGLLIWKGSQWLWEGELEYGVIVGFMMYLNMFFAPLRQLADRFNNLQNGMVAANRIFKLLDDKELPEKGGDKRPEVAGNIRFDKVWFAYEAEQYVLRDLSFELKEGKTLALVGATGAGKSSVVNLISRLYEFQRGDILLDGISVRDFDLDYLRSKVTVVMQEVFLFSGTIADNIRLFNPMITDEQIVEAAKSVGAHEFISQLPGTYQHKVSERGSSLSLGQRQLISFARALAQDPAILVLDEATSNIDSHTEELIQRAIEVLLKGRTCIVIAHRLSTIQHADEILVMDKGEVTERGKHQELLARQGYYYRLHQHQYQQEAI